MRRGIRNTAGFTLIELMVVIIILGLLAAIVMPRIVGETDKARYGRPWRRCAFLRTP